VIETKTFCTLLNRLKIFALVYFSDVRFSNFKR